MRRNIFNPAPEVIKLFFMLNSVENEICSAYKKIKYHQFKLSSSTAVLSMKFFLLINIKMLTIVGILIFINRKNFMLNWVEYEKKFYDLGACSWLKRPKVNQRNYSYHMEWTSCLLDVLLILWLTAIVPLFTLTTIVKKILCAYANVDTQPWAG